MNYPGPGWSGMGHHIRETSSGLLVPDRAFTEKSDAPSESNPIDWEILPNGEVEPIEGGGGEENTLALVQFEYQPGFNTLGEQPGVIQFNKPVNEILRSTKVRLSRTDFNGFPTHVFQEMLLGTSPTPSLNGPSGGLYPAVVFIAGVGGSRLAFRIINRVGSSEGGEAVFFSIEVLHSSNKTEPPPEVEAFTEGEPVSLYLAGRYSRLETYGFTEIGAGVATKTINHELPNVLETKYLTAQATFQGTEASVLRIAALTLTQIQFTRTVTGAKGTIHWVVRTLRNTEP